LWVHTGEWEVTADKLSGNLRVEMDSAASTNISLTKSYLVSLCPTEVARTS
jgi:hypothetical protein